MTALLRGLPESPPITGAFGQGETDLLRLRDWHLASARCAERLQALCFAPCLEASIGELRKSKGFYFDPEDAQGEEGVLRPGDQRPERFAVGDKVDALVTAFDKAARKVGLSIKAMEIKDEKEAVEQYGSADSGASLGDILGAALKGAKKDE